MSAINESMIDMLYNMEKTNKLLKKTPMYKQLVKENKEMKEKIRSLEYAVQYLELKNAKLKKKMYKKPVEVKIEKMSSNEIVDLTEEDDEDNEDNKIVLIIEECNEPENNSTHTEDSSFHRFINVVEDDEEEYDLENEVVLEAEEKAEEKVEADDEKEEEEAEEEEVEADEEEVEADEEEVEAEEEEEVEVEAEEESEEEDVYEIEINGKTYYVQNEIDSIIYEADEEGEITIEAGMFKNGKAIFA